jgi:hypothetical protein
MEMTDAPILMEDWLHQAQTALNAHEELLEAKMEAGKYSDDDETALLHVAIQQIIYALTPDET